MEGKTLIGEIGKCVSIATREYSGNLDSDGLRTKIGDEQWHYEYHQKYQGQFLQDSLHGKGQYSWSPLNEPVVYEGLFYANDLEGYGKFSYNDNGVFEGLFRRNNRFGPGIYTYPDGSQDVGMWLGKNLIRLCCVVKSEWVPRLAKTPTAKVKLLKFKKLVSVSTIHKTRAKAIFESLDVNQDVMEQSSMLYNIHIRNPESHFFDAALYDKQYFCEEDCYIDVALSPEEKEAYEEERIEEKPSQEQYDIGNDLLFTSTNIVCDCEDPKQIRLDEIKSELQRTEEALSRIKNEIKKAQFIKKLAMDRPISATEIRKSVGWEKIEIIGGDSTSITSITNKVMFEGGLELGSDGEQPKEEFELEESEEIDFEAACKVLTAVQNAERLLLRKKRNLTAKLVYESKSIKKECAIELPTTKRILITDLLAWNNGEISIDMLKHVFLHRKFEEGMSYCVADLLAGERSKFRDPGTYEEECIAFLKYCSDGNVRKAAGLLHKHDLNPDLCDAKGNTGIIYAAARDKVRMIQALVNSGANVDMFNDECLTPLGMCVTRYLAIQLCVTDWKEAFLKSISIDKQEELEICEWRSHVSSINNSLQPQNEKIPENLNRQAEQTSHLTLEILTRFLGSNLDVNNFIGPISEVQQQLHKVETPHDFQEMYSLKNEAHQPFVLSMECVRPQTEKDKKSTKEKTAKKGKKTKASKGSKELEKPKRINKDLESSKKPLTALNHKSIETDEMLEEETLRNCRLNAIYDTIEILLRYGADPNACEVPVPTLILAIFTRNLTLVKDLLYRKADPNVTTLDEKLTPLHVIVSLPPGQELVEIIKLLIEYSADPNCRASVNHWLAQKMELVAQRQLEEEDEGKTPLQLLSMRYDFVLDTNNYLNQMAQMLMEHGGKVKTRYLGHTPLSLAIMRGNLKLMKTFLATKRINPNQPLGEKMGVPLTLFILKRYQDVLPDVNKCEDIIRLLLEYKANPFENIEEYGNVIEFMIKEHEEPPKPEKQKKMKKDKGNKKGKGKSKSKSSGSKKSGKKGKKDKKGKKGKQVQEEVKKLLTAAAKNVLEKHIKGYAVKYLYFFIEEEDFYDDVSANMAKFVTPEETIRIAQILVHRGEIPVDKPNCYDILYDLVEFIINVNAKSKTNDGPASAHVDINKMFEDFEFSRIPKERGKLDLPEPEAEQHSEKYNICFHCYRKKNCQLYICPDCHLIYFCSEQCNILNNREKLLVHKCGTLFYNQQKQIHEERLARGCHWQRTAKYRKQLSQLAVQKGWIQEMSEEDVSPKRHVQADPTRRLHLTRDLQRQDHKQTRKVTGSERLEVVSVSNASLTKQSDTINLKHGKKLFLGGENATAALKKGAYNVGMEKEGVRQLSKKTRQGELEQGTGRRLGEDIKSENVEFENGGQNRSSKDATPKREDACQLPADEKSVRKREKEVNHDVRAKNNPGDNVCKGKKDSRKATTSLSKVTEGVDSEPKTNLVGYASTPTEGKIVELENRLPSKYQYFLEKISEFWPGFDLSMLFLPYACYSDGQLYYRFLSKKPVFMHTYNIT